MEKRALTERDICTKFITPAVVAAGRDFGAQIREEVGFARSRITVRGRLVTRSKATRRRLLDALLHEALTPFLAEVA